MTSATTCWPSTTARTTPSGARGGAGRRAQAGRQADGPDAGQLGSGRGTDVAPEAAAAYGRVLPPPGRQWNFVTDEGDLFKGASGARGWTSRPAGTSSSRSPGRRARTVRSTCCGGSAGAWHRAWARGLASSVASAPFQRRQRPFSVTRQAGGSGDGSSCGSPIPNLADERQRRAIRRRGRGRHPRTACSRCRPRRPERPGRPERPERPGRRRFARLRGGPGGHGRSSRP